jgi:type II secretory pathway pseudopilin PulG
MLGLPRLKGLEAMPIRLMASMTIIAIVVSVSFYELNTFLEFQKQKQFKEELVNIRQAMRTLQSMGDRGSFTSIELSVPGGYTVFFDNTTDRVIGNLGGEEFTVNLTGSLTQLTFPSGCNATGCLLQPADYEIRLIYGGLGEPKNYSIIFE